MHTYLPEEQKKILRTEYLLRLLIVGLLLASGVVYAGSIFLLPAYIESHTERSAKEYALSDEGQKKLIAEIKDIEIRLKGANDFGNKLLEGTQHPSLVSAVSIATSARVPGVLLKNFELSSNASSSIDLRVSGSATTRDALVAFKDKVAAVPGVQRVELPVSDLAKSRDISFIMRIQAK